MSLGTLGILTPETMKAHRMTWFVWAGGVKMRHQAIMRGTWGHDATCSCGNWEPRTGGAVKSYVESLVFDHRLDAQLTESPGDQEIPAALPAVPPVL